MGPEPVSYRPAFKVYALNPFWDHVHALSTHANYASAVQAAERINGYIEDTSSGRIFGPFKRIFNTIPASPDLP